MIDENAVPRANPGLDLVSLSPSAEQYFLLSRVDGKLSVADLCRTCGLGREKTLATLISLIEAGAVEVDGFSPTRVPKDAPVDSASPADPASPAEPATTLEPRAPKLAAISSDFGAEPSEISQAQVSEAQAAEAQVSEAQISEVQAAEAHASKAQTDKQRSAELSPAQLPTYPIALDQFQFDPELLNCPSAMDQPLRREMICLHDQLDQMSFYDLFGLNDDASRKEIKKSYFRLSKRYHPDRFFRQDLGLLGPIQEKVFKELTHAYKILSKKRSREQYDRELEAQRVSAQRASVQRPEGLSGGLSEVSIPEVADEQKRRAVGALLMRRAEKLMEQREYSRATAEFRKALALTRDSQVAMTVGNRLLEEARLPEEAASFARAALKLGADRAAAHFLIGRALELQGSVKAAVIEYRRALGMVPDHRGALERLKELGQLL